MTSLQQPPTPTSATPAPSAGGLDAEHQPVHGLDPAQQSLADAMRVSFNVLKVVMVFLVLFYCASGIFKVDEQHRAVRLRFGKIIGDPGQRVYTPGWHFGLPVPIEEKIMVRITPQKIDFTKAFWNQTQAGNLEQMTQTRAEQAQAAGERALNPELDGSLLTGDANIVHSQNKVTYSISADNDAVNFIENVGTQEMAEKIVRAAVERGIVHAAAQTEADEFLSGRANQQLAKRRAQAILDELGTGIQIQTLAASATSVPLPVYASWHAVSNAESFKGKMIDEASKDYATILGQTAGEARDALYALIEEHDLAYEPAKIKALSDELTQSLSDLRMSPQRGGEQIGGMASEVINQAITYRTQVVEVVKAEAETFRLLLDNYRKTPAILINRLWEDMREEILSGDIEAKYMPTGNVWIEQNQDPVIQREREKRRIEAQTLKLQEEQKLRTERGAAFTPSMEPPPGAPN